MWTIIINVIITIISIALALVAYYFDIKRKLVEQANAEIANAQDEAKDNAERKAYVVAQLKKLVPAPFRLILTDKTLESIAQAAFDKVKEYAKKYIDEKSAEVEAEKAEHSAV